MRAARRPMAEVRVVIPTDMAITVAGITDTADMAVTVMEATAAVDMADTGAEGTEEAAVDTVAGMAAGIVNMRGHSAGAVFETE